jgi:hypothetical protein
MAQLQRGGGRGLGPCVNKQEQAEQNKEHVALQRVFFKGRISVDHCINTNPKEREKDLRIPQVQ